MIALPASIQAVLFDLDGTLYDSESFYFKVYRDYILEHYGIAISKDVFNFFELVEDDMLITHLIEKGRIVDEAGRSPAEIRAAILEESMRRFDELLESESAQEGAALLRDFRVRVAVPFALVTCSEPPQVDPYLDTYGLRELFSVILTGEAVATKKPDPEVYLTALELLEVSAGEVVAIEDAPRGVLSALEAGIAVIRPTRFLLDRESVAGAIEVADLKSALDLIEQHCVESPR